LAKFWTGAGSPCKFQDFATGCDLTKVRGVAVKTKVDLRTVDLSAYPELVVIYLGMRVRTFPGIKTLLGLGPQIDKAGLPQGDARVASASLLEFISMKQSGARGFFLSRLKVGINGIR
jgi:hypothetical protein